ncbi:uncharacterized protein LOC121050369 [Rosa chinensis]|uniref:uncharacterized protein LOC121050369 n=1 Tax=Rosa chinensis TaxID=74649 RepID=UPI001AD939F4|nr:uncharacterized protein LOC121050369 [Rosa chinensis]
MKKRRTTYIIVGTLEFYPERPPDDSDDFPRFFFYFSNGFGDRPSSNGQEPTRMVNLSNQTIGKMRGSELVICQTESLERLNINSINTLNTELQTDTLDLKDEEQDYQNNTTEEKAAASFNCTVPTYTSIIEKTSYVDAPTHFCKKHLLLITTNLS